MVQARQVLGLAPGAGLEWIVPIAGPIPKSGDRMY